ncbi:MAG: hypothetical protein H7196_02025 [candidate division SR1 bacterium]|nr:hypothetical protein [candidate division SR1 bacterium]
MTPPQPVSKTSIRSFLFENKGIIAASLLTILVVFFFFVIGFPQFFSSIRYFSQRWFGIGVVCVYLIISFFICALQCWSLPRLFSTWVQTNILFLFAIAYFIRLNNSSLNFSTFEISTELVFIPLSIFIFFVNKNLFQSNKTKVLYILGQVILISLCVFSLVYYIEIDNTAKRAYSNDLLLQLFKLPSYFWLVLSAFTISLISTLSLKLKESINALSIFIFFFLTTIQTEIILSNLNFGYWAKTLVLIIIWDYLFNAILSFLKYPEYDKHRVKLIISTVYHVALLVIIFLFNYISI